MWHHCGDVDDVGQGGRHAMRHIIDTVAVPGSHLAASQVVVDDPVKGAQMSREIDEQGIPWQCRTPAEFAAMFDGLEPVEPGLVNLKNRRPDPAQPSLRPVPDQIASYVGVTETRTDVYEYGGILRKP
jgi:hypothetical protein